MTEIGAPTPFGPYLIVRASDAGGLRRADLALRTDGKDPGACVLKRLPGAVDDGEREERLRRELESAARLEHENIVRTLRVEKIEGVLCLAQELVEGASLATLMRQLGVRPLPVGVAVHVAREVARALAYAHGFGRLGIAHRDVTPENILLSFDGEVKLVDFGIARSAADEAATHLGIVVGRHSYVPPEAWDGGEIDCRADLFALGVVLWEMLTGRRAEETPDPALADPRQLNSDVAPLLAQIVERATAPSAEDRFPSGDELGAALAGFVPAGADPRRELADLLGLCFDVGLQRRRVADDVAEARRFLEGEGLPQASASAAALARQTPAAATVAMVAPVAAKRERHFGPWVAATAAAIVATSGIGLLRTHGRAARARASAEPLYAVAPTPAPVAVAPALAPSPPVPAPTRTLAAEPAPATSPARGLPPRPEPPRRVAGRTAEAVEHAPRNTEADALLARANDLWERGNTAAAYTLARQAAAAGAGAPAHVLLGTLLISMRNYTGAGAELETAVRLDARDAEARRMLALVRKTSAESSDR